MLFVQPHRYLVAFNGGRDFYQLPLALHERNLLSSLVTDCYFPHDRPLLRHFPGFSFLRHRFSPGLPSSKVHWTANALAPHFVPRHYRVDPLVLFDSVDAAISSGALKHAEREHAHLFLYSYYAYHAFVSERSRSMVKGLFMFHPHPDLVRSILESDFANHPECRESYEAELDTSAHTARRDEIRDEWKYADFIVCASSFTSRSLQHAGCSSDIISIVPYGIDVGALSVARSFPIQRTCRFLFVGQGVQRKGLHHLLRAWNSVSLAGAELTVIATNIDRGIAALAGKNVRILPRQSREELLYHYHASDVFVMPSLIEGFGLVFLEALAAGCRCIGTRNTGLADLESFFPSDVHAITIIDAGHIDQIALALEESYLLHRRRELDRERIRELSRGLTWQKFRASIGAIAHQHLPG